MGATATTEAHDALEATVCVDKIGPCENFVAFEAAVTFNPITSVSALESFLMWVAFEATEASKETAFIKPTVVEKEELVWEEVNLSIVLIELADTTSVGVVVLIELCEILPVCDILVLMILPSTGY